MRWMKLLCKAMIGLIVDHVGEVTGVAPGTEPSDIDAAYQWWTEATATHLMAPNDIEHRPLILLDTIEVLREAFPRFHSGEHDKKRYNTFEAVCLQVPAGHSIFGVGCSATFHRDDIILTKANIHRLAALHPLRLEDMDAAFKTWCGDTPARTATGRTAFVDEVMKLPLWELTAGLPRLLRMSVESTAHVSLASGSASALNVCYTKFLRQVQRLYPLGDGITAAHACSCFLASMTKLPIKSGQAVIPTPPEHAVPKLTYATAQD
jgi:hypothetical protein